jgi:hypothetical protein
VASPGPLLLLLPLALGLLLGTHLVQQQQQGWGQKMAQKEQQQQGQQQQGQQQEGPWR